MAEKWVPAFTNTTNVFGFARPGCYVGWVKRSETHHLTFVAGEF